MAPETMEIVKWFVGVPAALLALLTLPYVILKYHLECRKLRYELRKLEHELGEVPSPSDTKQPGRLFAWMAHYWPIPCYGSMALFAIFAAVFRSPILFAMAFGTSLMFLVVGSAIAERYSQLTGKRTW